jgi:hypothetical protein
MLFQSFQTAGKFGIQQAVHCLLRCHRNQG